MSGRAPSRTWAGHPVFTCRFCAYETTADPVSVDEHEVAVHRQELGLVPEADPVTGRPIVRTARGSIVAPSAPADDNDIDRAVKRLHADSASAPATPAATEE